jgi:ubiquinone/menaquinone biosynthesis C-methylase UbiE
MSNTNSHKEAIAEKAFTRQSVKFDQLYSTDAIIQYKRKRVRDHIDELVVSSSAMLELNAGTGEDAIYFAGKGHRVHATDISAGMLEMISKKIAGKEVQEHISMERCSFNDLNGLQKRGPYDHVYSNFGGLNCTPQLDKVLVSLSSVIKPGGTVTLVVISKFCLWETLLLFRGKFKTAFRRFFSKQGRAANVEGTSFLCWYYSPFYIIKHLKGFELISLEGLCTIVPPSYIEGFGEKHPKLFSFLKSKENAWKSKWPWNRTGDYFIISLRKK